MRKQVLLTVLSLVAFIFSANATKDNQSSSMNVNSSESKVVWLGKKVTGQHSGTIELKNGNLEFDGAELKGGSFEIDMTSIKNTDLENEEYNQKLVGHLKSDDFFGVEKYPTALFEIKKVEKKGAGKYHLKGEVTIKGITKSIEFPAQVSMSDGKATASASVTIDRSEFDVKYGSGSFFDGLGDKMIYDDFTLDITIIANK